MDEVESQGYGLYQHKELKMVDTIQENLVKAQSVWQLVKQVMSEYTGSENLREKTLLNKMAGVAGWDQKEMLNVEPLVQFYLRNNPDWTIVRGRSGGVVSKPEADKRAAVKEAKALAKKEMQEVLEARLANVIVDVTAGMPPVTDDVVVSDDIEPVAEEADLDDIEVGDKEYQQVDGGLDDVMVKELHEDFEYELDDLGI